MNSENILGHCEPLKSSFTQLEITNLYYSKEWRFQIHVTVFPAENALRESENDTCLAGFDWLDWLDWLDRYIVNSFIPPDWLIG